MSRSKRGTGIANAMSGGSEQEAFENLANAIIIQAVVDYKKALKRPHTPANKKTIKEIESFFKSKYFKGFTDVDGVRLMNLIREEMEGRK